MRPKARVESILALVGVAAAACGGSSGGNPGNPDGAEGPDGPPVVDGAPRIDASPPDADPCGIDRNATVNAVLTTTADDDMRVLVNGAIVDEAIHTWHEPQQYTIPIFRYPHRKNLIALEASNRIAVNGLDRAVLVDLTYEVEGVRHTVATTAEWKVHAEADPGWETLAYDDAFWTHAVDLGPHGIPPWNDVFGVLTPGTPARWLWTYAATGTAESKVAVETIYLRGTFYVGQDGVPSVTDPVCGGAPGR